MSKTNFINALCQPLLALKTLSYDQEVEDFEVIKNKDTVNLILKFKEPEDEAKKVRVVDYNDAA